MFFCKGHRRVRQNIAFIEINASNPKFSFPEQISETTKDPAFEVGTRRGNTLLGGLWPAFGQPHLSNKLLMS